MRLCKGSTSWLDPVLRACLVPKYSGILESIYTKLVDRMIEGAELNDNDVSRELARYLFDSGLITSVV